MDTASLVAALSEPRAWPSEPPEVELIETHISLVFLLGERVYKLKKPLVLPFLDYGTLERRRAMCEAELELNRRLAPEVYLRVAPITREADGGIVLDGRGEVVEWAVEMRRLPAQQMLDALLERGEVDNALMRELAAKLAEFHARAATGEGVDEHASPAAIARNVRENFEELAAHVDDGAQVLSRRLLERLSISAEHALVALNELFEARVAAGRAREGHGDLHAGNVCVTPAGIVAYDCIEFSRRLRCSDVACDLAFLAMDLDARGYRGFAEILVREYAERSGDAELERLMSFYKTYRAVVRGKVGALRATAASVSSERERARAAAMRYLHLAASYTLPPLLVLTCGLPASGKSWIAEHVARPFEAVSIASDLRRKLLARIPLDAHLGAGLDAGLYAPALKERTYESLLASAHTALSRGRSIVVDATFPSAARRAPFRELARELRAPFVVVWCRASEDEVRRRMLARASDRAGVSDADWNVYVHASRTFEAPSELATFEVVQHESGKMLEEATTARVIDAVLEQLASDASLRVPTVS